MELQHAAGFVEEQYVTRGKEADLAGRDDSFGKVPCQGPSKREKERRDLMVGSDDARFADVVGTRFGTCGMEYFAHLGSYWRSRSVLEDDTLHIKR